MEERIWHRSYDEGVPPSLDYSNTPLHAILEQAAAQFPERRAIWFLGKSLTYRELLEQVNRFAGGLTSLGVKKGDRVALYLPNVPHFIIAFFGALKAGAICVGTNPLYTERELLHQTKDSGAKVLVTLDLQLTLPKVEAIQQQAGVETVIVGRVNEYLPFPKNLLYPIAKRKDLAPVPRRRDYVRFANLLARAFLPPAVDVKPSDPAVLQYTGGTTGISKGATLTHRNLMVCTEQAWTWGSARKNTPQDRFLIVLPLYHSFAMSLGMNYGIRMASELILFPTKPKPDLSDFLAVIRSQRPTTLPGVPTLYIAMCNNPRLSEYGVDCIKICQCAAAPMPLEVMHKFEHLTGARILEGYGLSECAPAVTCNPLAGVRKPGSCGVPLPDTDVRIVDEETGTSDVKPGESGEIIVRGPQVMLGYWGREDETRHSIRDGWFYTGDIGRLDEDGYLFIVDRKKDMIITGGFNIYPREVEEVLYEHPKVLEAAAIGVNDARSGERVKVFIVLKEGQNATAEEVIAFCREKLAPYKVPKLVEFRTELPKSNIGKVLRRLLREEEANRPPPEGT